MQDAEQQWSGLAQLASAVALALAVSCLLWAGYRLIQGLLPDNAPVSTSSIGAGSSPGTSQQGFEDLTQLPLFGRRQAAVSLPVGAQQTKLDYRLRGAIPGAEADQGLAIIEVDGRQRSYRVGDPIDSEQDISLHEVHADHVVIARVGRFESLPLAKPEAAAHRQPARSAVRPAITRLPNATPLIDNAQLIQSIKALPHFEQGQQKGFRIQVAPQHAHLLRSLGLRNTDVITAVNGIELNNPTKAMELARQLKNADQVEVQLRRDGSQQTLTIDTDKLRN